MSDVGQVVAQMAAAGMPPLPPNHPILDGKYKRFGPQKKGWYILREMTLRSGRRVVTGAFGLFQGEQRNTVPVTVDFADMSDDDMAEYARKQKDYKEKEEADRRRAAELAANRGTDQWNKAAGRALTHAYMAKKRISAEGVRVGADGQLLIPLSRAGRLVGLQKIDAAGVKNYNKDADMIGAACILGELAAAAMIGVGEGYATCRTVRMLADLPDWRHGALPVVMACTAGNIMHVARDLRGAHPAAHLLFLVDDDYQIRQRLAARLLEDFKVSVAVPIDGETHQVIADDGEPVAVMAIWRKDACGIDYIEADVRRDRMIKTFKFENAGLARCTAAAAAVGNASLAMPAFADRGENKWSDFNDLMVAESIESVASQIGFSILAAQRPSIDSPALSASAPARPAVAAHDAGTIPPWMDDTIATGPDSPLPLKADAAPGVKGFVSLEWALAHCALVQGSTDVWDAVNKLRMKRPAFIGIIGKDGAKVWESHADRRAISPRNLPRTVRGVASEDGGAGGDNIVMMLDRYVFLYGTKTVWDADKEIILGYDAMALARGNDLASRWLAHPLHREVDLDKLVFDPTQRVDLNTHINMFKGFPLTPRYDEAKASLVLDLLYSLCASESNRDEVFQWVLRWLAYPLQHPGAKMQTGLLFFGEKQGTGKSLFFEGIVKPIYGAYGATGGQHQLEGTYTMWRSQKLFVLFEEILSRQDKYSYFGLIKHMITGRDTPISQKFKDDRVEDNHMNCVMLSNEFQTIPLEPEDRRFLVVDVKTNLDPGLLERITAVLGDGLIEAFYAFLLNYPLGDFDAHAKPLMTPSKERVINFGRPDWEAFYLTWAAGDLVAPYCSCLSTDLYIIYARHCSKFGFRSLSVTKFAELIAQRLKKDRQWVAIGAGVKKLLTVFHVPQEEGKDESISKQCERFRDLADIRDAG